VTTKNKGKVTTGKQWDKTQWKCGELQGEGLNQNYKENQN